MILKLGDIVKLKSGSPALTVTHQSKDGVSVVAWDGGPKFLTVPLEAIYIEGDRRREKRESKMLEAKSSFLTQFVLNQAGVFADLNAFSAVQEATQAWEEIQSRIQRETPVDPSRIA